MWIALGLLAAVLTTAVLFLLSLPGDYEVKRCREIKVSAETLFATLRNFKSWPDWSPWLIHEPDCTLEFSDNFDQEGGWYRWDGQYVGSGRLEHLQLDSPLHLELKIQFFKPFKSEARVGFELQAATDGFTELCWTMHGRMPLLLRWLTPMLKRMIGNDYELGLVRLQGLLDAEAETLKLDFKAQQTLETQTALIKDFDCNMAELGPVMREGFATLLQQLQQAGLAPSAAPLCLYQKADPKKDRFKGQMAMPVADTNKARFAGQTTTIAGGKYLIVTVTGAYDFLKLAWHAAIAHSKMHKLKIDGQRPLLEIYDSDPTRVSANELQTRIAIPLK